MIDQFKKFVKSVFGSTLTEEQKKALEDFKEDSEATPNPPANDDKNQTAKADPVLLAELKELKALNKKLEEALGAEYKAREDTKKATEERLKAENAKKVEDQVKKDIEAGKIPAKDETEIKKWTDYYTKDFEAASFAMSKIPGTKTDDQSAVVGSAAGGASAGSMADSAQKARLDAAAYFNQAAKVN